jgi:hypothetical protein
VNHLVSLRLLFQPLEVLEMEDDRKRVSPKFKAEDMRVEQGRNDPGEVGNT